MEETIDKLFDTLNMVRSTPHIYAARLASMRDRFQGDIYRTDSKEIRTFEGIKPVDELIGQLNLMRPVRPLKWSFSLHVVADDQVQYLGNSGLASHLGPGGQKLPQRVSPYAIVNGRVNEVIELGSSSSSEILMDLLVDDGLITRKRRRALLDPNYEYIGIAWGMHRAHGFCTVIVLADNVSELTIVQPNSNLVELDKVKTIADLQQPFYKVLPNPRDNRVHHIVQEETTEVTGPPQFSSQAAMVQTFPASGLPPRAYSSVQAPYPQGPSGHLQGLPPQQPQSQSRCSIM